MIEYYTVYPAKLQEEPFFSSLFLHKKGAPKRSFFFDKF